MKVVEIDDKKYMVTNHARIEQVSDLSNLQKNTDYDTMLTIDGWYLFLTETIEAEFTEVKE